jgi:hypothetical protein
LAEHGFFVKELNIGWQEWVADNLPVEAGSSPRAGANRMQESKKT